MRTRLVERAREGDNVAISELVDLDGDLCCAIAYRILRDVERFSPWLYRLLVSACYEEIRRHRRWISHISVLRVDGPRGPDPIVSVDDRDTLDRAFRRGTPEHRAVFVLHHHTRYPH
jgi:hypothetical protein